jgi:hypothetical protein
MRDFDELCIRSEDILNDEDMLMGIIEEVVAEEPETQQAQENLLQLNRVFAMTIAQSLEEFAFITRHYFYTKLSDHIQLYMYDVELQIQIELFVRRYLNEQLDIELFKSIMQIFHILEGVTYDHYLTLTC